MIWLRRMYVLAMYERDRWHIHAMFMYLIIQCDVIVANGVDIFR